MAIHGSIYPGDFYQQRAVKARADYCLVLMPFAPELKPVFETICAVIETEPWNFVCRRAGDFFAGGHILADILQGIRRQKL